MPTNTSEPDDGDQRDRKLIDDAKAWVEEISQEPSEFAASPDGRLIDQRTREFQADTLPFIRTNEVPAGGDDSPEDIEDWVVQDGSVPTKRFGDYDILKVLGRGGMGIVFLTHHRKLKRMVALKMIRSGLFADRRELLRFQTEVEAVASLDHPHIVPILEYGMVGQQHYFTMKYVQGSPLSERSESYANHPSKLVELMIPVALAVHHAHQRGILHRDLKPGNILVDSQGCPYVVDFGLARRMDSEMAITMPGEALGTPSYMAPEQATGKQKEITVTTDVYGLGAVLYSLLTGRAPFQGTSVLETLELVKLGQMDAPSILNPGIPRDLEVICLKCLQREPSHRYASASDLADDLKNFLAGRPIQARPVNSLRRLQLWTWRNPGLATLTMTSGLLLVGITAVSTWSAWTLQAKNREINSQNSEILQKNAEVNLQRIAALQNAELAKRQADLARERADLALGSYQTLISEVEQRLAKTPENTELRRDLLMFSVNGLRKLAKELEKVSQAEPSLAAALAKLGDLLKDNGDHEIATEIYEEAYQIVRDRPQLMGSTDSTRLNVALILQRLATSAQVIDRDLNQSLRFDHEAIKYAQHILDRPKPGEGSVPAKIALQVLFQGHNHLLNTYKRLGMPAQQLSTTQSLVEICKRLEEMASNDAERTNFQMLRAQTDFNQAVMLEANDLRPQAALAYQSALQGTRDLAAQISHDARIKQLSGSITASYGWFLLLGGETDAALPMLREAKNEFKAMQEAEPTNVERINRLAIIQYRLGVAMQATGDPAAEQALRDCMSLRMSLVETDPSHFKWKTGLAVVAARLGLRVQALELAREVEPQAATDIELLRELGRIYSVCALDAEINEAADLRDHAIRFLEQAEKLGYRTWVSLRDEPDLVALREDARFQDLIVRLSTQ